MHTGLFGTKESFVPLQQADLRGTDLHLQYDKDTIKGAPGIADDGHLSDDEQGSLFDYYDGRAGGVPSGVGGAPTGLGGTAGDRTDTFGERTGGRHGVSDDRGAVGQDTSGPNTDEAMTRSEEQLRVGTQEVQTGRVRLRKHIVTDQQTVTVPVTREEVRLEREPITDANRGDALAGPDLSEEEHEVVLTEELPVVTKETVPVERVRLEKEEVTENRQVTEDVRHEEITTDDDGRGRR